MDYDFLRNQYDKFNEDLLGSTFTISATIYIQGEEVGQESIKPSMGRNLDGRKDNFTSISYPLDLNASYRVTVFPIELSGLRLSESQTIQHDFSTRFTPFDKWISIKREDISIRGDSGTYLDFISHIQIGSFEYNVKGSVSDNTGHKPVVHVFLEKRLKR